MTKIPAWAMEEATEVARRWFHEEWVVDDADYMQAALVAGIARALVKAKEQGIAEGRERFIQEEMMRSVVSRRNPMNGCQCDTCQRNRRNAGL